MNEHPETTIANTAANPVPVVQAVTDVYQRVGPNGFFIVLAGVVILGIMSMFWFSLRTGQEAQKVSQDQVYQQLKEERTQASADKVAAELREVRLLDRSDKQAQSSTDRWEKSREKQVVLESRVESLATKMDVMLLEVKAISLTIKSPIVPVEKK